MGETALTVTTPLNPGAIGLIQLHGPGTAQLLETLTGVCDWPTGRLRLVPLAQIDRGLVVLLRDQWAQIMPHGGPRLMQLLVDRLIECGATYDAEPADVELYPEAACALEAQMLSTMARAASPLAVDLLAAQGTLWRRWMEAPPGSRQDPSRILRQSDVLDRLIDPASVVVVGRPNVGKSTLSNHMLGRAASIVADLPGTTRDWVAGLAELVPLRADASPPSTDIGARSGMATDADHSATCNLRLAPQDPHRAVAVRWLDTPGLRHGRDDVEQTAIELARQVIAAADVLVAMRDPSTDWPDPSALPRPAQVWVVNKIDLVSPAPAPGRGTGDGDPIAISAANGTGVDVLTQCVLTQLGLAEVGDDVLWAFSPTLRAAVAGGTDVDLSDYVGTGAP